MYMSVITHTVHIVFDTLYSMHSCYFVCKMKKKVFIEFCVEIKSCAVKMYKCWKRISDKDAMSRPRVYLIADKKTGHPNAFTSNGQLRKN